MNSVYYVTNEKPKSHNVRSGTQAYKEFHAQRFREKYLQLYSGLPTKEKPLQSQIVYIYHNLKKGCIPDVDNLCKPIIDAFTGIIYEDDEQIGKREAIRIPLEDLEVVTIDMSKMPEAIATDLDSFIVNQENHILLLTVDKFDLRNIKIGEI